MAGKDISEKILFSNNDIFADIVNVLLCGGKQLVLPEELTPDETITQLKIGGTIHLQDRDIAKIWTKNNTKVAILGIENQTKQELDMILRALAYDGASCKKQVIDGKSGKNYVPCPVITMVLYFGKTHWTAPKTLFELYDKVGVVIPDEFKPYINDYKLNVFEISFLDQKTVNMFQSDFRIVADYFVQTRENDEYKPDTETMTHVHEVLTLLSVLATDERFKIILDKANEEEEAKTMCEVLDKVENRGITKGRQQQLRASICAIADALSHDEIAKRFHLSLETVEDIIAKGNPDEANEAGETKE